MADIRPLGSERLDGLDKIKRIMEIANYNHTISEPVNENASSHYNITFADGNQYGIVKEKSGYIIKKVVSEGVTDYLEPMKNRKYFSSYSQALKKLNLMIKETNSLVGNEEGVSLFGEQKKFVLKTPKPAQEAVPPAPEAPVAPELPEPELPVSDVPSEDMPAEDMPMDDTSMDSEMGMDQPSADEEPVSFKVIQKLTGKLTQKIRQFAAEQEMSSEDIKYVINMVLSSVDLASLSTEDKDEIMTKFESDEADAVIDGGDDKDGTDLTDDTEVEDIQNYMDVENDADMVDAGATEQGFGETEDGEQTEQWQAALGRMATSYVANKAMDKISDMVSSVSNNEGEVEEEKSVVEKNLLDHLFSESKVDKVLSKYFEVSDTEKRMIQEKKAQSNLRKKYIVEKTMKSVKKLSESVEQQLAAEKFLEENPSFSLVGKTNKKNLVFENKNKQTKISPEGILV
jgi:hypothetical protein